MRCLERNKQVFHYALKKGVSEKTDADGYYTGEYGISYGRPVREYGNISPNRGNAIREQFGISLPYDKTIVMDDPKHPIAEDSAVWIGIPPMGNEPNYIVVAIARSINSTSVAVREVKKNA